MSKYVANGQGYPSSLAFRYAMFVVVLACLLSWGSAFNTRVLDLPFRMVFWASAIVLILAQCRLVWFGLAKTLATSEPARFACGIAAALIATALFVLELNLVKSLDLSPKPPEAFWHAFNHFAAPSVLLNLLVAYVAGPPPLAQRAANAQSNPDTPWPKTAPEWIRAQDHYLEMFDGKKSTLLRARIRDVSTQYPEKLGIQVHRSWWVRRDTPERLERAGRDTIIITKSGVRIPVSRRNQKWVRELLEQRSDLDHSNR